MDLLIFIFVAVISFKSLCFCFNSDERDKIIYNYKFTIYYKCR